MAQVLAVDLPPGPAIGLFRGQLAGRLGARWRQRSFARTSDGFIRLSIWVPRDPGVYAEVIESLAAVNRWLRSGRFYPLLYESRVFYDRADQDEVLQSLPALYSRGKGDCEDLVAARLSELEPTSKALLEPQRVNDSGGIDYHVVIRHPSGRREDPTPQLTR